VRVSVAKKGKGGREPRGKRRLAAREAKSDQLRRTDARITREVAGRAVRRLDVLEYFILLAAVILALLGGALVAWILGTEVGFPFRISWAVASLLLFIVPGGIVYLRELRRERERSGPDLISEPKDFHG